jgi:hypothetical protein
MQLPVVCPQCQNEFQLTDVMYSQILNRVRSELAVETTAKQRVFDEQSQLLSQREAKLEAERKSIPEEIQKAVEVERTRLEFEAASKARKDVEVELKDRDEQLAEKDQKLKQSQAAELELLKKHRDLESEKAELELEVERKLNEGRQKLREEALKQFEEKHLLRDAEKDKMISDLKRNMADMERRLEQGSQQLQGEVLEIELESLLRRTFPIDTIAEVAKGVSGGDVVQNVMDQRGSKCGQILWESKRTKNWSNNWLTKLKDDMRSSRAQCGVIVSEALPDEVRHFMFIDGVWVCSWACVAALASALRQGLIEIGRSQLSAQGQQEKMAVLYGYLSSSEFRHRIEAIVDSLVAMEQDLASEKRSQLARWSKRGKQIQRSIESSASLYGDLQGILGATLPDLESLTLGVDCEDRLLTIAE